MTNTKPANQIEVARGTRAWYWRVYDWQRNLLAVGVAGSRKSAEKAAKAYA